MCRRLMTYMLVGIYLSMQMVAVPHTHAAAPGHSEHDHGATHFHCDWASSGHHHHDSDHSHEAHDHHHPQQTADEIPSISNPLPHDTDAVYVGDAFVTSAVRIAQSDAQDDLSVAVNPILVSLAPIEFDGHNSFFESAENFFAESDLYLILRALRI